MDTGASFCATCLIPGTVPGVTLNDSGMCSICADWRRPERQADLRAGLALNRLEELKEVANQINREAHERGTKYDCVIGASGGFDSTYVIYVARRLLGLNPLVVKYDNGVAHPLANKNLQEACSKLGVDLRIVDVIPHERNYLVTATKGLRHLGVFFSACFSCHYTIRAVVYRMARQENVRYMLTSSNAIESNLAKSSHRFMFKALIEGFFTCGLRRMLTVMGFGILAAYYLCRLKFHFDGLSLRLLRNLVRLHPPLPPLLHAVVISDYLGWDYMRIEKTLREELNWNTPRTTKVPYFRFDCYFSALIDNSFKKVCGVSEHALLCNWFAQAALIRKHELAADFAYMNSDERIDGDMRKVARRLGIRLT